MSRQWFGAWGATLSDEDLACAIAALGCLWHSSDPHHFDNALSSALTRRPTEWRLRPYAPFGFHQNQLDQLPRAADLASAWKASAERHRVWRTSERALGAQLRVCDRSTLPFDPGGSWWNSVLSRAAGVDAVTWESTGQANSSRWHWPLRVGLLGGETSVRLAAEFDGAEFPELRRVVRADQTDEGLGLVVLPVDLTAALAVPPPAHRPPIHTVVVLGGGGDAPEPVVLLDAVRARFRAGAAAVLSIDPLNYGRWIRELTVELAEDAPLEIALFSSQRAVSPRGPAPLIVSGHGSLDVARISQLARATAKRVDAIEHSSLPDSTLAFEAPSFPALQRPAAHSRPPPANAPITASPAAVRSITVCPKCGRENLGAYRFCLGCGSELPRPADRKTPPGGFAVASAPSWPASDRRARRSSSGRWGASWAVMQLRPPLR